jgi:hypothetical protein
MRLFLGMEGLITERAQREGITILITYCNWIISLGSLWLDFGNTEFKVRRTKWKT